METVKLIVQVPKSKEDTSLGLLGKKKMVHRRKGSRRNDPRGMANAEKGPRKFENGSTWCLTCL
jgi:hypothetical protein